MPHRKSSSSPLPDLSPSPDLQFSPAIAWALWGLLTLVLLWRVVLATSVFLNPPMAGMLGGAFIFWRRLDEFLPWLTVGILLLIKDGTAASLGRQRLTRILLAILATGTGATALGILIDHAELGASLATAATRIGLFLLLILCLIMAMREVKGAYASLRRQTNRGMTIIDLWRFAATQWVLLMAVALFGIAVSSSKDEWLGNETIRSLFFLLPAIAALPQVMLAGGVSLWNDMLRAAGKTATTPLVRAWLIAFGAMNVGPLLFLAAILPRLQAVWLVYPATAFIILGIILYIVGFPVSAWRGIGGKIHLASWLCLGIGILAALIEITRRAKGDPMSPFYGAAWRFAWSGAPLLWLVAMGSSAMKLLVSDARSLRLSLAAFGLLAAGIVASTGVLLVASTQSGGGQGQMARWVLVGCLIMLPGLLIVAVGLVQSRRQEMAEGRPPSAEQADA